MPGERRLRDELHPTATRTTDASRQLVGTAFEGDSGRTIRVGRPLLAGTYPLRAHHLLRGLRPGRRHPGCRGGDQGFGGKQVAASGRGRARRAGRPRRLLLAWHDGIGTAILDLGVGDLHGPPEGSYGHRVQAEHRERVAYGTERRALGSLRGRPSGLARGRAALPGAGLLSLVWLVGIYALIFGIALIVLGFRTRDHRQASESRVR